jgi:GT2 family glycosyltransferase
MVTSDITIIIPIYRNVNFSVKNISTIIKTGFKGRIIIINDFPNEPKILDLELISKEYEEQILLINNETNIGYTKSINKALKISESEFSLICNSDILLHNEVIEKLKNNIKKYDFISGISPVSDNAGNCSIKELTFDWKLMDTESVNIIIQEINKKLLLQFGDGLFIQPTINGYCTLWRHTDIKNIGFFDEVNFSRGYGEEDDICLNLSQQGKQVAVLPSAFVPHLRSQSFTNEEKIYLKSLGKEKLIEKWGLEKYQEVINFFSKSPINIAYNEIK